MNRLEFRKVNNEEDMTRLREFLLTQPQLYPNYAKWVNEKALPRVQKGQAEALLVIQDDVVIGDAIYQLLPLPDEFESRRDQTRHKTYRRLPGPKKIDIRNFRIDPNYRTYKLGTSLMYQVLNEGAMLAGVDPKDLRIVTDVSARNFDTVGFFVRNRFRIVGMEDLYRPGQPEYLLERAA